MLRVNASDGAMRVRQRSHRRRAGVAAHIQICSLRHHAYAAVFSVIGELILEIICYLIQRCTPQLTDLPATIRFCSSLPEHHFLFFFCLVANFLSSCIEIHLRKRRLLPQSSRLGI